MENKDTQPETINIDNDCMFENPFDNLSVTKEESLLLFENWIKHPKNKKIIEIIDNKKITSNESESTGWTRSEVLRKIAASSGNRRELTTVTRDILSNKAGIICHQVNCMGKMNSGIAKSIRDKWPSVYDSYMEMKVKIPGAVQFVRVNSESNGLPLYVCNVFGQEKYGYMGRYTIYMAVKSAFKRIKKLYPCFTKEYTLPIFIPYKMGCDRGGGDWDKYSAIIKKYIPEAIICKLPE